MPSLHHTGLTVANLDRALAFWQDALGLEVVLQQEKAQGYLAEMVAEPSAHVRMAHLAFAGDGSRVELFEFLAPPGERLTIRPQDVGFAHVCVLCEDIDGLLARLVKAGGTPLSGVADVDTGANAGSRAVYVRDPDGHVVELFEARARASGA